MHRCNENGSLCRYGDSRSTYVSYCDKSDNKEIRFLKKIGSGWVVVDVQRHAIMLMSVLCVCIVF